MNLNGVPTGDPFLLFDATVTGARVAPQEDRALIAGCRRISNFDRPFSTFARANGSTSTLSPRTPADGECKAEDDLDAVWTGARSIVAWSSRSWPFGVDVDVVDQDGRTALSHHLDQAGGVSPRLSLGHGAVLLASALQKAPPDSTLSFQRIGFDGALLGEPTLVDVAGSVSGIVLYSVDKGWIARAFPSSEPPLRIELGPDGTSLTGSGQSTNVAGPAFVSFQRPSGGFVLVRSYETKEQSSAQIEWRRGDESLEASWTAPPGEVLRSPAVGLFGGRTYVVYQRPEKNSEPNQIVLRQFGCSR